MTTRLPRTAFLPLAAASLLAFQLVPSMAADRDAQFFQSVRGEWTGPGEIALWLPARFGSRYLVLGQVRAASGAK